MTQSPATKLLAIVHERQRIPLEELLACCPELRWNQVFSLVDDLSRHALIGLVSAWCRLRITSAFIIRQVVGSFIESVSER